jgi:hypothetical protein
MTSIRYIDSSAKLANWGIGGRATVSYLKLVRKAKK